MDANGAIEVRALSLTTNSGLLHGREKAFSLSWPPICIYRHDHVDFQSENSQNVSSSRHSGLGPLSNELSL